MESTLIHVGLVQEPVELMNNHCSVRAPAILASEDQVEWIACFRVQLGQRLDQLIATARGFPSGPRQVARSANFIR